MPRGPMEDGHQPGHPVTTPPPSRRGLTSPGDWPVPDGLRSDETGWLALAVVGLAVGLLAPLAILVAARDGGEGDGAAPVPTSVDSAPPTELLTDTTVAPDTVAATTTVAAPPTTVAPDTTVPDTTETPETTAEVEVDPSTTEAAPTTQPTASTAPAIPGLIRVAGTEHPILRTCRTSPLAATDPERSVTSYLYDDDGYVGIVEKWQDGDGATGGNFSSGGFPLQVESFEDRGADGFAVYPLQPGGAFEVVVEPSSSEPDDCAATSSVTTNTPGADDAYTRSVVDVCFGDAAGPLQYVGFLSEGARFTAEPINDSTVDLTYDEPGIFELVDDSASQSESGGVVEFRGTAEGSNPVGPVTKDVVIRVPSGPIRACTDLD